MQKKIPTSEESAEEDEVVPPMEEPRQKELEKSAPSEFEGICAESEVDLTDAEILKLWKEEKPTKYKKVLRAQPILKNDGASFECICDIDNEFQRY